MHEGAVDQHQSRKAKGDGWKFRRDFDGDDPENYDEAVGDVEIVPSRGEAKDLARPVAPVEDEFLDNVKSVGSNAKPKHDLKMAHLTSPHLHEPDHNA